MARSLIRRPTRRQPRRGQETKKQPRSHFRHFWQRPKSAAGGCRASLRGVCGPSLRSPLHSNEVVQSNLIRSDLLTPHTLACFRSPTPPLLSLFVRTALHEESHTTSLLFLPAPPLLSFFCRHPRAPPPAERGSKHRPIPRVSRLCFRFFSYARRSSLDPSSRTPLSHPGLPGSACPPSTVSPPPPPPPFGAFGRPLHFHASPAFLSSSSSRSCSSFFPARALRAFDRARTAGPLFHARRPLSPNLSLAIASVAFSLASLHPPSGVLHLLPLSHVPAFRTRSISLPLLLRRRPPAAPRLSQRLPPPHLPHPLADTRHPLARGTATSRECSGIHAFLSPWRENSSSPPSPSRLGVSFQSVPFRCR